MSRIRASVLVLAMGVPAAAAQPDGRPNPLSAALAERRSGDPEAALASLRAFVREQPGDPYADDALDVAARLLHKELRRPAEALATYRDLLRRWPTSRHARRAKLAADQLEADLAGGPDSSQALAELLGIQADPTLDPLTRATALRRHLAAWPGFAGAPRVRLLLAEALVQLGLDAEAEPLYARVLADRPSGLSHARAARALGDLRVRSRDLAGARAAYAELFRDGEPGGRIGAEELLGRVDALAQKRRLVLAALGALLGCFGGLALWARIWRRPAALLWPPPLESVVLLAAVCIGLLVTTVWVERPGRLRELLSMLGFGAVIWTWLLAAAVRCRAPGGWGRWLLPVAAGLVVVCLWYVAVGHQALIPGGAS